MDADALDAIGERALALTLQSLTLWQDLIRSEGRLWLFTKGVLAPCGV